MMPCMGRSEGDERQGTEKVARDVRTKKKGTQPSKCFDTLA